MDFVIFPFDWGCLLQSLENFDIPGCYLDIFRVIPRFLFANGPFPLFDQHFLVLGYALLCSLFLVPVMCQCEGLLPSGSHLATLNQVGLLYSDSLVKLILVWLILIWWELVSWKLISLIACPIWIISIWAG